MADIRIAVVGLGKIARDQHLPEIAAHPAFELCAVLARHGAADAGVPVFADLDTLLREARPDAIAICTPPGPRHGIARTCLERGLHVLMEKPPCATLGEVADLAELAGRQGRTLFTTWHAQCNETVATAAAITRAEGVATLAIEWVEDVEKWHPGQNWIWEAGGFGVFDPGINALSIATQLCPEPLRVRAADFVMEAQGQQPERVTLQLETGGVKTGIGAHFDFRYPHGEHWTIDVTTQAGTKLALSEGGAVLRVNGGEPERTSGREYGDIYRRFAELVATGESLVDVEPLRLVADAMLVAQRR